MQFKRFAAVPAAVAGAALMVGASLPAQAQVQAQSQVQLGGLVDVFAGSMRYAGAPNHKVGMGDSGMSTSWFGVSGEEALDNGIKVGFKLGSFLRATTGAYGRFNGDTFWARDARVGVMGRFGELWLGRNTAPNFLPTILFNPFGDSFAFSPLVLHSNVALGFNPTTWSETSAADTGWSNQVSYTTPSLAGLTARVQYQFADKNAAGTGSVGNGKRNVAAGLMYFHGPIGLTGYWEQARSNNPTVTALPHERNNWMVGGSYNFQVAKLYATYGHSNGGARDGKMIATDSRRTFSLGASVPAGAGSILAAYANTHSDFAHATRQTATVGYDYNLSKRTDLYANLMYDHLERTAGATSFGAGIRHRF